MALFGGESKEDKQVKKAFEVLKKYGMEDLSDQRDLENVSSIAMKLAGSNLINLGTALSGSGADVGKMSLLQAIVEQNWIIIRMLDKLNNK